MGEGRGGRGGEEGSGSSVRIVRVLEAGTTDEPTVQACSEGTAFAPVVCLENGWTGTTLDLMRTWGRGRSVGERSGSSVYIYIYIIDFPSGLAGSRSRVR